MRRLIHFLSTIALLVLLTLLAPVRVWGQQATASAPPTAPVQTATSELAGVRDFTRVDTTFACGGALSADAITSIKQAGFKSIVNLRAASEEGADVELQAKAAAGAGLKYIWLPFVTASPDAAKVDQFLEAVADPANQPMLLHCARGGRASMFWAIKRVMIDGWSVEKALNELPDLVKNVSAPLKAFTLEYLKQHGKGL